ncbi:glycosyltransferase family 4 protein [Alkalihalobacterium alkalinitrilicum]|uniref:glycosyltransferase family 4 protein n=1 Tax=Alkalihalobacterium alkalinitrilicum TaxID=427920 RepID=UPI001C581816|nr:glycosyltransferase family 4 protein [Alkalihalobacterium alkalinitrilicum]
MKKVFFVMNTMRAGGAERVVSLLANNLVVKGQDVSIIVTSNDNSFYKLNNKINYCKLGCCSKDLNLFNKLKTNFLEILKLIRVLKREKPDVVITFIRNIPTIIACKVAGIKVIVSERNNPIYDPPNKVWRFLRRIIYPFANGFVFQTDAVKGYFDLNIQKKSVVIPNPVNEELPICNNNKKRKVIVSVGRLSKQKDHATLIKAFGIVRKTFTDYELIIYGEGNLREDLLEMIENLGLKDSVFLPGNAKNLYSEICDASVFVLSSKYEGFPNALIEAMALGLPVISTKCNYGPSEIIKNGENGFLVEVGDYEELAKKINYVIKNKSISEKIGNNAYAIRDKLSTEKIIKKWIDYINLVK